MLILSGARALSDFRLAKRLASIRAQVPSVTGLDAGFVHVVELALAAVQRQATVYTIKRFFTK